MYPDAGFHLFYGTFKMMIKINVENLCSMQQTRRLKNVFNFTVPVYF